jgi:hypothetical protein
MSKLSKQRRVVKLLDDFFGDVHYSDNSTYNYRIQNLNKGGVPEDDFTFHILQNLRWRDKLYYFLKGRKYSENLRHQWALDRSFKIERLYNSCKNENLIELALREHPLTWKMTGQIIAVLVGTGVVGYILLNLVKHYIFKLPFG